MTHPACEPYLSLGKPLLDAESCASVNALTRVCANVVLVTSLLPYLSPIVFPNIDVQFMGIVTSTAVVAILALCRSKLLSFTIRDLCVLCFGFFSLIYINNIPHEWIQYARVCAPVILGFPVYFATRNLYRYMSPKVFGAIVASYAGGLLLQIGFPNVYQAVFSVLLNRIQNEIGSRAGGLCDEPSYMGEMCVFFVAALYFFHCEYWKQHKRVARSIVITSGIMLLLARSALGFIFAIVIVLVAFFSSKVSLLFKATLIPAIVLVILLLGNVVSSFDSREAFIASQFLKNPLLIFQDFSISARCVGPLTAIYGLSNSPFGTGDIYINKKATNDAFSGSISRTIWPSNSFYMYYMESIPKHDNVHLGASGIIERMGIVGVLGLFFLLCCINGISGKWVVRVYFIAVLANSSMLLSTLWFLIGCCAAQRTKRNVYADKQSELL